LCRAGAPDRLCDPNFPTPVTAFDVYVVVTHAHDARSSVAGDGSGNRANWKGPRRMASTLAKSLRSDPISRLELRGPLTAPPDTSIEDVVRQMTQRRTGCALLVDGDGKLVGIFTERDFVQRVVAAGLGTGGPVSEVMTRDPKTLARHDNVQKAVELMGSNGYRQMPVLGEDGRPVGVLSVKEIVHYLVEYFPAKVYNLPPTPDQAQPAREGA
jgi:CBS domain-containing protein